VSLVRLRPVWMTNHPPSVLGGTAAAVPLPFRPGNPALCGSWPLVTPYYCRLGDLLCYNCMLYFSYHFVCMHVYFVFSLFSGLFSFVDFPSVLWYCWLGLVTFKNCLPYNPYCVGGYVKHCTIQSNQCFDTVGLVIRPVKTVGRITYIVLVQTLNHAQSIC